MTLAATALFGVLYSGLQWRDTGTLSDAGFVCIISLNAGVAYLFGFHIAPHLANMQADLDHGDHSPETRISNILAHSTALPVALLYASAIGLGAYSLNPLESETFLRHALGLFLFAGNIMIGLGLCAILRFWFSVFQALPRLRFRILNLSHPPLPTLLRIHSKIVLVTALISSLSLVSLGLSNFALEGATIFHSAFALLFVIATYAVPVLPLSNALKHQKSQELDQIERRIAAHVDRLATGQTAPECPNLKDLEEARSMIAAVRTLPPGGQVSVSAAAIVAFLSFLPTLIDYAKDIFLS